MGATLFATFTFLRPKPHPYWQSGSAHLIIETFRQNSLSAKFLRHVLPVSATYLWNNFSTYAMDTGEIIMKICHVAHGVMPVPPVGWGAVESLIWDYKISAERLGHAFCVVNTANPDEIVSQVTACQPDVVQV